MIVLNNKPGNLVEPIVARVEPLLERLNKLC